MRALYRTEYRQTVCLCFTNALTSSLILAYLALGPWSLALGKLQVATVQDWQVSVPPQLHCVRLKSNDRLMPVSCFATTTPWGLGWAGRMLYGGPGWSVRCGWGRRSWAKMDGEPYEVWGWRFEVGGSRFEVRGSGLGGWWMLWMDGWMDG
ncbi:hypothetical protein EYC84_005652 [Monilinia fructicola]|uniref:Uncharacterized protein n=1 Tax=Monilinia fructicola TaxID=38448 RepID=A0A5M9K038_MONFR|nr:hypothetical protein EYC84_005652 [Monilinia fructicola]